MRYDRAMSYKDIRSRYILLARIFIVLAVFGLAALILTNTGEDPSHVTFSMIAFVISVAALLLTTIQSTTIVKQMQLTERAVREVRETGERLQSLITKDQRLASEIRHDIALDQEIIAALEEYGLGATDKERHAVAKHIQAKLKPPVDKH